MRIRITVLLGAVMMCVIWAALVRHTRPVLLRIPFGVNHLTGDRNYVLFNPFRDRSPERTAAIYLDAMRRGDCSDPAVVNSSVTLPNGLTCEQMQNEYRDHSPLFVQPLRDRNDTGSDVELYYSTSGYEGNWVTLRVSGSTWRVIGFNKIW